MKNSIKLLSALFHVLHFMSSPVVVDVEVLDKIGVTFDTYITKPSYYNNLEDLLLKYNGNFQPDDC